MSVLKKIDLLGGKNRILLISPQNWDSIQVSKHHSNAKTLAKMGNTIYFVNPPQRGGLFPGVMLNSSGFENLQVVSYAFGFPYWLKFKAKGLFEKLVRFRAKAIAKACDFPDIVWDFDNVATFPDLRAFGSKTRIFHPVDLLSEGVRDDKGADVIFSVGQIILDCISGNAERYLIQHGLGTAFVEHAKRKLERLAASQEIIMVRYALDI